MSAATIDQAAAAIETAAWALGEARAHEMALEDMRPIVKRDAIRRLMQTTNDLTGKAHSASSAESVVEADEHYRAHRRLQADAVVATQVAWGRYEAARVRGIALAHAAGVEAC